MSSNTGDYGTIEPNGLDGSTELTDSDGVSHDMNQEIYRGLCRTGWPYMRQSDTNVNWSQYVHIWDPL